VTSPADATRPAEAVLRIVQERYGLDTPLSSRRLSGGYANDVFLLVGSQKLVLHVKHPPVDIDSLTWEHRLLHVLAERLPEVPPPLPVLDGSTFVLHFGRPVWLTEYRHGTPARPADRVAVAAALGRLHAVEIDVPVRPGRSRLRELPIPALRPLPPAFDPWLERLAAARSDLFALT
jgi:Ser/Thr protein kinase RdoA (MazF antagonist)